MFSVIVYYIYELLSLILVEGLGFLVLMNTIHIISSCLFQNSEHSEIQEGPSLDQSKFYCNSMCELYKKNLGGKKCVHMHESSSCEVDVNNGHVYLHPGFPHFIISHFNHLGVDKYLKKTSS